MELPEHIDQTPSQMSDFDLDSAIRETMQAVTENPSDTSLVIYFASLVSAQRSRQFLAKARIGEYFRQKALQQERASQTSAREDRIDSVHADKYAHLIILRYSDIEKLAPWTERDTQSQFAAEQQRRLKIILEANPKLTEKQRGVLEAIAAKDQRIRHDHKYGTSYGPFDGRVINGLVKRGFLETKAYGVGFRQDAMLILADINADR